MSNDRRPVSPAFSDELSFDTQCLWDSFENHDDSFRLLCDRSSMGMLVIQLESAVYANPAATMMLGCAESALLGNSLTSFIHEDDRPNFQKLISQVLSRKVERTSSTFRIRRDNAEVRWVEASICQLPIRQDANYVIYLSDVTNAMLQRNADLADNQRSQYRLEQENEYLRKKAKSKLSHGRIVGRSDALSSVLNLAERVSRTNTSVLLTGETGTGKELLAEWIHEQSDRRAKPMIVVNCASLPATLVESELFGREAGAYTGAASAQFGRFSLADGSTLFLDEIGEFPIELQAKLLRVLEDGKFEPLGGRKTVQVDVRIIAATNRDLAAEMAAGRFRMDLYHRLNVFPIRIAPLRERAVDIPLLAWSFVESFGLRMGKKIEHIPKTVMEQLQCYSWPGNVRELSNVIERAMILCTGNQLEIELPAEIAQNLTDHKKAERDTILRVLQVCGWRIRGTNGAAVRLDLKPTTLEARMAKLGIERPGNSQIIRSNT